MSFARAAPKTFYSMMSLYINLRICFPKEVESDSYLSNLQFPWVGKYAIRNCLRNDAQLPGIILKRVCRRAILKLGLSNKLSLLI